MTLFAMRHAAFAALALCAMAPVHTRAQIVPSGTHAPTVVDTANGVPQVNVQKPSGAGVSLNTYSQFDVQKNGAILNNSPVITNTQLAGQINGNPNFGPHDAARIIVNQVNSNNPSQLRGYVEVAGQKTATVVIANASGLVVDGGGFINTSRGILTTGNPLVDAGGYLTGFNVTQGNITVEGAGFNASNLDQADLIARAVQVNAAIYGKTLDVVTGANHVDYASLHATPIQASGAAPGVSIDVSQLGGMYANRIALVGTENGVGVANAGVLAAQAGDLTLTTHGQLVQSGQMTASGNVAVDAGSVVNSGTIYAQQATSIDTAAALTNSGTLAAQQSTSIRAGSVSSTGLLGAGINGDGALGASGELAVLAAGQLVATGQNVAAGSVTLDGASLDLSNAQTWAGTALNLSATGGDLSLVNANTGAGASVTANVAGTLDNSGGTVNAPQLAIHAGNLTNRSGTIAQTGSGATEIAVSGTLDNTGGLLHTNSTDLTLASATLVNDGGTIANSGIGTLSVSTGALSNDGGTLATNGALDVLAGAVSNRGGALLAGRALSMHSRGALDNTAGLIHASGDTTVSAQGAITNVSGSIHGNGALTLDAASLDNTSGSIGNDEGGGGSVAITTAMLANRNGTIGSDRDLTLTTNELAGDGTIIAGQDGAVTVNGDYTHGAANRIQANHDLALTVAGNLTNQGTLAAVNALTVNAANVDNQAGADLNSTRTTLNAAHAITNEGRIEGDVVTTNSATLINTATIIGHTVTLNGSQSIANAGAAAVIAGAAQVNLYSPGDISNTDGANVVSLGDVVIAADAARDANGLLANRANSVTNDQSTLQAQRNIEIAAQTLTNTRPAPDVETVTTDVSTLHQTKRSKYMACATMNADGHSPCTQDVWDYGYKSPVDSTFLPSQVVSATAGPNVTDKVLVVDVDGTLRTIYYNSLTNNGDGTVTVSYWDDYDPNVNYDPASEYISRSDAHNGYQRVEIARDTTTTTHQDQVSGMQAAQAQLLAGGNLTLANVGTLNNEYSAIAAGGSIQIGSTTQDGALDSGSYGGTLVNNVGQTLYQYQQQDIVSTYAWNEDIGRDVGTVVQPSVVLAPVAIGGTGGTIVANHAVSISGTDIDNTNVAAANSATGATGSTPGANQVLTGQQVNAPQTAADSSGSLHFILPTSGLYSLQTAPDAAYLVETDPRFTSYAKFISSDYMLGQLGLNPQSVEKRLGDGLYEQQLVQNQITQLTGRVYLQGYSSALDEYAALMTSGVNFAQQFGLEIGMALTAAQMDALTSDIVWLVSQTVTLPDGSTQKVLVPQVSLAQTHANDLQPGGALIAADDVRLHAGGSVTNMGTIQGGAQTVITGTDIVNRAGTIVSSGADGTTIVSASHDVLNASGVIGGNRVGVLAGNDIINTTLVDTAGLSSEAGGSKVEQTLLGAPGTIVSTGDLLMSAGNDLTVRGANIVAGGNASIGAGHDITVDAVQSVTSQSLMQNANRHWEAIGVTNETSAITAGGSLVMQSGNDMTFRGAQVTAGGDLMAVAGGNLSATAVIDTAKYDNVATDSKTRKQVDHTYDEQVVGTRFTAGGDATLAAISADASKGDVTLTGSSLTAGVVDGVDRGAGAANILATGSVVLEEAREEHDSQTNVTARRGSFVNRTTLTDNVDTRSNRAVGSVVSGNAVNIGANGDVTIQGSAVVGTNDVAIAAKGDIDVVAAQGTTQYAELHAVRRTGLSGSGALGVTLGSSEYKETYDGSSVTESQSRSVVGSVQGNVSLTAGQDLHIGGSDIVAGKAMGDTTGATGNIVLTGQNVTIDPGLDTAQQHAQQEAHSSGLTVGITGTPFDTARNVRQSASSGNAYQRTTNVLTSVGSSTLDIPSLSISYGRSSSSGAWDANSSVYTGSTVQGAGNVLLVAIGGAQRDEAGNALDGDLTVTGSTVTAGRTASFYANRDVTLQASTDQYGQSSSSSSSSSSFMLATPSLGDVVRWITGTPNNAGVGPSPYSASSASANGDGAVAQQTPTVVSGNQVVVTAHTGNIDVIGSGIAGTEGVSLTATQGNINVLAGMETATSRQESRSRQVGNLGSNGTSTGFSVGVASSHTVQDSAAQTQSTMRSQLVSTEGDVSLDAKQDVTVIGSDLSAANDLTVKGANVYFDPGTDSTQDSINHSSSQWGVTVALGGVAGDTMAAVNWGMNSAASGDDARLAALNGAKAVLAAYGTRKAVQAASEGNAPALVKVTVGVGGGTSHANEQDSSVTNMGSTLAAGRDLTVIATGSGATGADGYAADGDIVAHGTQMSAQNVTLNAARDIDLESAKDTMQFDSSDRGGSFGVGIGASIGGSQNGFTVELSASGAKGFANGTSTTNRDTRVSASDTLSMTSGRDTTLAGAQVSGDTVKTDVGRDLTIVSPQDTASYDGKQANAGFNLSLCVPPLCVGQPVSGSASVGGQSVTNSYQSVNQQSGIYAGEGGFDVQVGNHTQLDGGVISSTATPDSNLLSTQTLGYTNLENHADYSGAAVGFSAATNRLSGGALPWIPSLGPTGFGATGTGDSASGTTYAAVSPGTIRVRGDADTGQDSTEGLSRDPASANGSVRNRFDAQAVGTDLAVQQGAVQVGMQVVGDLADALANNARENAIDALNRLLEAQASGDTAAAARAQAGLDAANAQLMLWSSEGTGRTGLHALTAGAAAALGGGSVAGAMAGTVAGDLANNAAGNAGGLAGNILSGAVGAAAGAVAGGATGAVSGANGALSADLYNRQLHPEEKTLAKQLADASGGKYTEQQIKDQMAQMNLTANGQTEWGSVRVAVGDQPNDGTTWTLYGVNQAGQQVWAQSLGAGNPDLQAYIVNGAQGSGLTYQATTTGSNPGLFRLPDFVNFQVDYLVGSVWGTFTRDGNSFFGYGVNAALPNVVNASASVQVGWLNTSTVSPGQTNQFMSGYAGSANSAFAVLGGGEVYSPGNGAATTFGIGVGRNLGKTTNPAAVSGGYTIDQGRYGKGW